MILSGSELLSTTATIGTPSFTASLIAKCSLFVSIITNKSGRPPIFLIPDNDFNNLSSFAENRFELKSQNPEPTFQNIKLYNRSFLDECIVNVEKFMREVMFAYKPIMKM